MATYMKPHVAYKKELALPCQAEHAILLIRGQWVMLDRDLAALYGVETKNLNKAVSRNIERFPNDFMFQLSADEAQECAASRFQIGTLKRGHNIKYLPYKLADLEHKIQEHDSDIRTLFDALRQLAAPPSNSPREIGFHVREARAPYRVQRKIPTGVTLTRGQRGSS